LGDAVNSSVDDVIRRRYSCRSYLERPIEAAIREALSEVLASLEAGPFGGRTRFGLVAATENDRKSLRGLGTYGFIKGAPGFIVGAVGAGDRNLEDYGFCLERAILEATDLGLQTCWLGGTFSKSSFGRAIGVTRGEMVPAVAAVGYPTEESRNGRMRQMAGSHSRLPWERLFFDGALDRPLDPAGAGAFAEVLEAVRWAPSASNKQPWRIVRTGDTWHFYLQRSKGSGRRSATAVLMRLADLPRVDLGIAMCHFALSAAERGLTGRWVLEEPQTIVAGSGWEYTAGWRASTA
jgi:nitroreductase